MKLRKHRKDIQWLKTCPNVPHAKEIAARYQRLISWAELVLSPNGYYYSPNIVARERRVLKDSKGE